MRDSASGMASGIGIPRPKGVNAPGSMKGMQMKFKTYESPNDLMDAIRLMVVELIQGEVFKIASSDPRYRRIIIQKSRRRPIFGGGNTISIYIVIDVSLVDHPSGASLEITVRVSDHPSDDMKDGEVVKKGNLTKTFIVRDVGNAMRVRGRNGIEHEWNSLDQDEHKIPLINGRDAVLPGDVRIEGRRSKYYIGPSERGTVGNTINRIKSDVMDCIHSFVHQMND